MGRAVVSFLKEDGLNVVALDVKGDCVRCDVRDAAAVKRVMEEIGPVDVLVNNAGILSNHKAEATTTQEWREVLAANLDGAFYLSREVIPGMKARRWGRIDRKSTRLNSSHSQISYAVFCLKKKRT